MNRQNLFSDAWDGENEEVGTRQRVFWRPDDARMGATLYELAPDAAETRMHMHFGAEEMFFVLSGRPLFRNQHGKEELAPGDFVFDAPETRMHMRRTSLRLRNAGASSYSVAPILASSGRQKIRCRVPTSSFSPSHASEKRL